MPVDRGICCHVGGNIDFDVDGNLLPVHGRRHEPVLLRRLRADRRLAEPQPGLRRPPQRRQHERPARQDPADPAEGRRRLHDPAGQPVPRRARAKTKPEIYAMGLRNPFRFAVNRKNGDLYVGDYSPDADAGRPAARPGRPRPLDADQASRPTMAGRTAPRRQLPYIDYDFATKTSGAAFNCKRADATTRRTTRASTTLPAGRAAGRLVLVRRRRRTSRELEPEGPEGNGGIAPMGGPAYEPIAGNSSPVPLPELLRGQAALLRVVARLHQGVPPQRAAPAERRSARSTRSSTTRWTWSSGPDGSLYVLEYGDGYFAENPDAQLSKINFVRGNRTPIVKVAAKPTGGRAPLTVAVLQRGHRRPGRRPARPTRGTSTPTARSTRRDAEPDAHVRAQRHLPPDAEGDRPHRARGLGRGAACSSATSRAGGRADHDDAGRRTTPFAVRRDRHLRGQGHRRHAGRLLEGHRRLRARPRAARPPAVLDRGLHGLDHDVRWTPATPARRT